MISFRKFTRNFPPLCNPTEPPHGWWTAHQTDTWLVNSSPNKYMIGQQLSELLHCWSTAHQKNITSYSRRNQEDWIEISLHCHDCSTYHKHTTWLDNISPTYHMIGQHFTNIQHDWSTYHKHTTWLVNISPTYHVIGQHITNIPHDWSIQTNTTREVLEDHGGHLSAA